MSMASLPNIRITSKICSLTATLDDKDNRSSDALSDIWSNSQETGGEFILTTHRDIYSAHAVRSPNLTIKC